MGPSSPKRVRERIAKLRQRCARVARHYAVSLTLSDDQRRVTAIHWDKQPIPGTMLSDPGVYCLRTNETSWDEATLWRTYMTLTDLEAVFRSLKSELGLRPDLPPQGASLRRPSVHLGTGLSVRPAYAPPAQA